MNQKQTFEYIPVGFFLVAISSVSTYLQTKTGFRFADLTLWWLLDVLILYLMFKGKKYFFDRSDKKDIFFVKLYLAWNIFSTLRGIFVAETFWDWKALISNGMQLLIPIVAYPATNQVIVQSVLSFYLKYTLPVFFIICFFISREAYGFYLVPISFLLLFIPVIHLRWKVIILFFTIVVLTVDLGARSNIIKFVIPILLLIIYFIRSIISVKLIGVLSKLLLIAPFILFYLAENNIFNPFNMNAYVKGDLVELRENERGEKEEENLLSDTRTFLYLEVLQSAAKYNSWLIGRTPARGNDTEWFADLKEIYGRAERYNNEAAILNIYNWTGIVGVLLYFLVFYKASYLAINQSNNIFCKMIGIYMAFRWCYAWVEDINEFTLTYFLIWVMLGLCFSQSFRSLSDEEVKVWVKGIFSKKDREIYLRNILQQEV